MTSFPAPDAPFVPAKYHGGKQIPTLIVLHSTVSPCDFGQARKIAAYFQRLTTPASAHYVVDPLAVVQCVGDHTVAYHCGYNQNSIGIEMCDEPTMDKSRWDDHNHVAMEKRTARLVAELCLAYNIPARYLDVPGLLKWDKGAPGGITTHANMSKAFHGSTHWDPGAWRRFRFMFRVRRQIRRIKAGR